MKIDRTKNSIKGIISGYLNKFISLLLPFIVQTIFINYLSIEYLGLNSLFVSILNILNLAELGVGSAISFSLYNSIARNDREEICSLINLYRKLYRIIGFSILGIGIILTPFIKYLCDASEVPNDINVYIVFIIYLCNTSFSYLLYSYKNSLFNAHQKVDVLNGIEIFVKVLLAIFQIIAIMIFKNYYLFLILMLLSTILKNVLLQVFSKKYYPNYEPIGEVSKEKKKNIFKKVRALFCYQIGTAVLTSVDSIVISKYLGLSILGKYNSYYFVITALFGFLQMTSNALVAGVGNSIATESVEKNFNDFKKLNTIQLWVICFCSACLICLYQNFIYLWIGSSNMLSFGVVICLTVDFFVWRTLDIVNLYKNAIGMWEYDKFRPIVAAVFNLILNIVLVKIIGIYGIIISTIISIVFIIFPWSTYVLFAKYFKKGYKLYLLECFRNVIITFLVVAITLFCCSFVGNITIKNILIRLLICLTIPNLLYLLFNVNKENFVESINWLLDKLKLKKIKSIFNSITKMISHLKYIMIILLILVILLLVYNYKKEESYFSNSIEMVHLSIDDTINIFYDLNSNKGKYHSIFENDMLRYLKKLHTKYGAKFSLYVYYKNKAFSLGDMTDKYKNQFEENSEWLKFGFHALSHNSNYNSNDSLYNDYKKVYLELERVVGKSSITRTIRLEKFLSNKNNLIELQQSEYKIDALLGSDKVERLNYYLNDKDNKKLFKKDIFEDDIIVIYNTDIRLENYNISVINNDELQDEVLVVFTHEWQLYSDNIRLRLEKLCYIVSNYNKEFLN